MGLGGAVIPESEVEFVFSRSSGPGGQNVNKLETRVTLLFDLRRSVRLSEAQKRRIGARLDGLLRIPGHHRLITSYPRVVIDISRLGHADYWVNEKTSF